MDSFIHQREAVDEGGLGGVGREGAQRKRKSKSIQQCGGPQLSDPTTACRSAVPACKVFFGWEAAAATAG